MTERVPLHASDPVFRVLRLPDHRRVEAAIEVEDPETGLLQSWNEWTADVLDGLAAGESFPALVDRLQARWPERKRARCDAILRRFLYTLHRLKAIDLHLEAPSSFAGGRYRTLKELGRGGVGVAWLCRDERSGDEVVVKRAWDYFAPLSTTDALVRAETAVMRALDHPGIAKPFDAFEEDGLFHLVRGYARGTELARWRGTGVKDPDARRALAASIADLVGHLHARGYLLLDLRPANFFVGPDATGPMLIDVGHCKPMVDGSVHLGKPKRGRAHGSPGFAAPETDEGSATIRTDVWGFGRLYSFIATGQLPRHGMTCAELVEKMRAQGASEEDIARIARLAADAPADRPADMREAEALFRA